MSLPAHPTTGALFASPEHAARFAEQFVKDFTAPAFGARSKSETDLLVFSLLIDAGLVDPKAHAFETAKRLTISTTKVKSLLQTWYLRHQPGEAELRQSIVEIILSARFVKDSNYVALTITNGFVRDYFVSRVQRLDHQADRSFNPEIVRITSDALADFMAAEAAETAAALKERLVRENIIADTSPTGVIKEVVKKIAMKVGDEAVGTIAGGLVGQTSDFIKGLFSGNADEAAVAAKDLLT